MRAGNGAMAKVPWEYETAVRSKWIADVRVPTHKSRGGRHGCGNSTSGRATALAASALLFLGLTDCDD